MKHHLVVEIVLAAVDGNREAGLMNFEHHYKIAVGMTESETERTAAVAVVAAEQRGLEPGVATKVAILAYATIFESVK